MTLAANHRLPLNGNKAFSYIGFSLLVFFFLFNITFTFAQAEAERQVHVINGQEFYIHKVEAGNTLYGISRMYSISVDELQKQNPRLSKKLSIGDKLLIPVKHVQKKDLKENLGHDGNYLIYIVQKKNTLYSIAKEFDVDVQDIRNENPQLAEGLKIGQELRIPLAKMRKDEGVKPISEPAVFGKYVSHTVQPKETLYSLSKMYNVQIDSILKVNDSLKNGLQIGQEINIPILLQKDWSSTEQKLSLDSSKIKDVYEIALLLPFYLDKIALPNDTMDFYFIEDEKIHFKHAKYGIEFYEGFLLAVDSMKKRGLSVKLYVYDTANDTSKLKKILRKSHMKNVDIIVGPLFFDEFLIASDFSKKYHINIVSPVKQSNKILLGNSYVSKVISSDPVLLKSLAAFMADSLKHENILIVYPDNVAERINSDIIMKNYKKHLSDSNDSSLYSLPSNFIWSKASSFSSLKLKLAMDSLYPVKNYIVCPSTNQAFVTQLLTSLNGISSKYDISVIGLQEWEKYSNLDLDYLHNLHVHLLLPEFVDESDPKVLIFKNTFFDEYSNLPEKFSYLGFDVGFYYLSLMHRYGANFNAVLPQYKKELLSRNFDFFQTGVESGFENHSFNLIKYSNYQKVKVR